MKTIINIITISLISVLALISCSDDKKQSAATNDKYVLGTHFKELKDPIEYTLEKGQEGIIWEVFSYSCAHCNSFEPVVNQWLKNTPKTVGFEHVPVYWNSNYETQAQAFYTAKILKVADKGHSKLFDAIHIQRARIGSLDDYANFYAQFGITKEQFLSTSQSFVVKGMVEKAREISAKGEVQGTPSLIVNGKYIVDSKTAKNRNEWLDIARFLVERDAKNK